ncbi:hypothetical protein PR048_004186 [Dryococelus australis]|uniref:Uncharacterized protein n=1 Tax=Dryococelus australis TaxID=614101 RepID=A0ABQ9I4S6_9NEOP|nr:hypothetical protein PR048_004186 [Dryococelus australis]
MADSKLGTYKSPNTLGKNVKRVRKTLPHSPGKKTAIISVNLVFNSTPQNTRTGPRKLTEDCIQSVLNFYHNDEISRQAPGKTDVKSVKDPNMGKRSLKQIHHMAMGIKEAYEEFKTSHPETTISRSVF